MDLNLSFAGLKGFNQNLTKEEFSMDKAKIEQFKNMFLQILGADYAQTTEVMSLAVGGDEIDTFTQEKAQQMQLRLQSRNSVYLKKVKYSLDKINAGTFGECEDCGAEIGEQRLFARPTATLCIHCKEEEEREGNQLNHKDRHSVKFAGNNVIPLTKEARLFSENMGPM